MPAHLPRRGQTLRSFKKRDLERRLERYRMLESFQRTFDEQVRLWASAASKDWDFPDPSEEFFAKLRERLPNGLLATIGFGIEKGIVLPSGRTFKIKGMNQSKGPYNWFSRDNANRRLNPNWEYYIQTAEYVRLWRAFGDEDYVLTFEDAFMDIGVYKGNRLLVCCEIKEKSSQAKKLIDGIKTYQAGIDPNAPDRGNDPLRKAKYIVHQRPLFFYLVAIGIRYEFGVFFPENKAFELREDIIPFI
jgi:hypothetical protein